MYVLIMDHSSQGWSTDLQWLEMIGTLRVAQAEIRFLTYNQHTPRLEKDKETSHLRRVYHKSVNSSFIKMHYLSRCQTAIKVSLRTVCL